MADLTALPVHGEVFLDDRGPERSLRVSWHREATVVVLSLWRYEFCIGTFRLRAEDVPLLIQVLSSGLGQAGPGQPGVDAADGSPEDPTARPVVVPESRPDPDAG